MGSPFELQGKIKIISELDRRRNEIESIRSGEMAPSEQEGEIVSSMEISRNNIFSLPVHAPD